MVYVVTAVHNRCRITENFVKALKNQSYKQIRLILVDDGSTDGTGEMVKALMPEAVVLQGNGKLWWGGALEKAYRYIKNQRYDMRDILLLANDDIIPEADFIKTGVELLEKHPEMQITGCGFDITSGKQMDGAVFHNFKTGKGELLPPNERGNCASTRALFMQIQTFLHIGGFHPFLLPHYGSDYEFTIRGAKKGHAVISDESLNYKFDRRTTGIKKKGRLAENFSKRSVFNPFYRFTYAILVTPVRYMPSYLYHMIRRRKKGE